MEFHGVSFFNLIYLSKTQDGNTVIDQYIVSVIFKWRIILTVEFVICNKHGAVLFIKIILTITCSITTELQWNALTI